MKSIYERAGMGFLRFSWGLFLISLLFPCYYCEGEPHNWAPSLDSTFGGKLLLIGWLGLLANEFVWLANVFWLAAMLVLYCESLGPSEDNTPPAALASVGFSLSLFAFACSISFIFQESTHFGSGAAGSTFVISGYGPGYVLWVASMGSQLFATLLLMLEGFLLVFGQKTP